METTLKSAPLWIVPENQEVRNLAALGSETSGAMREPGPGPATREYRIPNLARACQVLRLFASSGDPLSSSSVARQLKMPRTTVLRILHTLAAERLLQRRGFDFLASSELRTGLRSIADADLCVAAGPTLNEIAQLTGETACLALPSGDKVAVVETCGGRAGSGWAAPMDLHCSAFGKVFLAFGPRVRLDRMPSSLQTRTQKTLTTSDALATECSRIVRQGYALDNEEAEVGVRGLAAPVWGRDGAVAAALGVSAPAATFTAERASDVATLVVQAAKKLTDTLAQRTSRL
jgi:DNA-binding IclR family transcriptional regulator